MNKRKILIKASMIKIYATAKLELKQLVSNQEKYFYLLDPKSPLIAVQARGSALTGVVSVTLTFS